MSTPNYTPGYGLCKCGCGQRTKLATRTATDRGWIKGEPLKWVMGHQKRKIGPEYTVEDRGHASACWIWTKSPDAQGYGVRWLPELKKHVKAHRWYYEQNIGPIPPRHEIDHLCRVRNCVNPLHLEAVTHRENVRRGMLAKLTPADVRDVQQELSAGSSMDVIAQRFGITRSAVEKIKYGDTWLKGENDRRKR